MLRLILMKALILYRPNSEHERSVIEFEGNFMRQTGRSLDKLNIDSIEGSQKARLYDIVSYPAVIATTNDGRLLKVWQGERLPLINEVSFYVSDGLPS